MEHADAKSLNDLLLYYLSTAKDQRDNHNGSSRPLARAGSRAIRFATNFSSFLQAYSGIVEIIKGADQQYGGLAYGILSLTLIVSNPYMLIDICLSNPDSCKQTTKEEHIDSALLILHREYSRFEVLRDIHSSDSMKRYVAERH